MSHETLKQFIAQAETASDRTEAVRKAVEQGMPLHEIEQFLDWLDHQRGPLADERSESNEVEAARQLTDDQHEPVRPTSTPERGRAAAK